jgi:predicted DNA-binding transcriptional regulator YafY
VRGGRLVSLVLLLEQRGRVTAATLARELEVSERTILRDLEELSGAGVPVYATRGPGGGFQLLDSYTSGLHPPVASPVGDRRPGRPRRARVRVTPEGRRLAAVLGRLQPLRVRRAEAPDDRGRLEASFRIASVEEAAMDVLALAPHVEVLEPADLRQEVARRARSLAVLHAGAGLDSYPAPLA